jgi:hypothetical protein
MKNQFFSLNRNRAASLGAALLLTAVASIGAPACSSEPPAPTTGGPIAIEAFREELEVARCELAVRCGFMPNQDTCRDVLSEDQELLQLLADVVFNKVSFDEAAARTCVDAIRAQSCETLSAVFKAVETACAGVFTGSVAEGGACLVDDECTGDADCDVSMCMGDGVCCMGVCAKPPALVPVGGDCSKSPCVEAAYCETMDDGMGNITGTCKARVTNGQPCNYVNACEEGLRCDLGGEGNCYTLAKEGQSCNPNLQNGACLRVDYWCSTTDKKCSKLPMPGEPCTDKMACVGHAYCDGVTCQVRALEGQDCKTDGSGAPCLGDLECQMDDMLMKSVCRRPQPASVCVADET